MPNNIKLLEKLLNKFKNIWKKNYSADSVENYNTNLYFAFPICTTKIYNKIFNNAQLDNVLKSLLLVFHSLSFQVVLLGPSRRGIVVISENVPKNFHLRKVMLNSKTQIQV